jgi:hypothetical protein
MAGPRASPAELLTYPTMDSEPVQTVWKPALSTSILYLLLQEYLHSPRHWTWRVDPTGFNFWLVSRFAPVPVTAKKDTVN